MHLVRGRSIARSLNGKRESTAEKFEKLLLKLRKKNLYEIFVTSHDMLLNHVQVILKYKEVIYVKRNLLQFVYIFKGEN